MDSARDKFVQVFGSAMGAREVRAPGRVNVIGEHVDYCEGVVCPIAIDRATTICFRARKDLRVRIFSTFVDEMEEFSVDGEVEKIRGGWGLYSKGVAEALRRKGLVKRGMDAVIETTIPLGAGLSSSAAIEVATALAILDVNEASLSGVDVALAAQWAEHEYAGVPCGIMDQYVCAMGRAGHVMVLDCRDLGVRHVALDDALRVVVVDTHVRHELTGGEYAERRAACERAIAEIGSLRDATMADVKRISDGVVQKRARHVVAEIGRVLDFAAALERRDCLRCGELMYASHASLRNDFEVSWREADFLVELARGVEGVFGARMTGGGFGGSVVALTTDDGAKNFLRRVEAEYEKFSGRRGMAFVTRASDGVRVVSDAT